jgi:hypothetical protein
MKKIYTTILWLLFSSLTFAQNTASQKIEMADLMRSNGKIYVVIVVMLTILAGLMIYLIRLERKIAKLEKEVSE